MLLTYRQEGCRSWNTKLKSICCFVIMLGAQAISGEQAMANEDISNLTDKAKLDSYRTQTTIAGVYLDAWNRFIEYTKSKNIHIDLNSYLITFSENETEYLIHFKHPRTRMILGGGDGLCRISKASMTIVEFKLSK